MRGRDAWLRTAPVVFAAGLGFLGGAFVFAGLAGRHGSLGMAGSLVMLAGIITFALQRERADTRVAGGRERGLRGAADAHAHTLGCSHMRAAPVFLAVLAGCHAESLSVGRPAEPPAIDLAKARTYFTEFETICSTDGGKLWGQSLCGPFLFVDPPTRQIVANRAAPTLAPRDGVFVGTLADSEVIANTALEWQGSRWTMMMWDDDFGDAARRRRFMLHEAFHRIEPTLGLEGIGGTNGQLDTADGRYWLGLEWNALQAALGAHDDTRAGAIADALGFRAARRARFADSAARENALEAFEGLAEYTGARLGGSSDGDVVANAAERRARSSGYVRSFAYVSGPLYGYLLDASAMPWRARVKKDTDLGALLAEAMKITPRPDPEKAAEAYGGPAIRLAEDERARKRELQLAEWRRVLVDGPVLVVPKSEVASGSFDPRKVYPLSDQQTVYTIRTLVATWGKLVVEDGAILEDDATARVSLAGATAESTKGPGWTLFLAKGWTVSPGERAGDRLLRRR